MDKKGNLLIIDDEVMLLEKTALILEDIADKVFIAESGKKGLELFTNEEVHCVICDINMPEMNGVEVLENIRSNNHQVPFIFYSGHGSRELMKAAIKLGAFDFIDKPNLDGLEEIAASGLKIGIYPESQREQSEFISEYQKLLNK